MDMGTGGGELFGALCAEYPGRAVATEEWSRNAPIAAQRLRPLGVRVVRCRSGALPFRDGAFHLVLNRHEEFDPAEVARIVAPGGRVLTEQVGREERRELRESFPRMTDFGPLSDRYRQGLEESGLEVVDARAHEGRVAYPSLGPVVYLLCLAPWAIPDFDPLDRDLDPLLAFEREHRTDRGIILTESAFLLEAMKPGRAGPGAFSESARAGRTQS